MNVLVVLGHPNAGSFCRGIADAVCRDLATRGHEVIFHDLCEEKFDPLLTTREITNRNAALDPVVEKHCAEVCTTDGIVLIHPNWWGQPPAILRGWVDRVFRPGRVYRFDEDENGEGIVVGMLKARAAVVINTSNTPIEKDRRLFGDPLETIWRRCVFEFCGVPAFHRKVFAPVIFSTLEQRKAWIEDAKRLCRNAFHPD